jgi:hypothetical protein
MVINVKGVAVMLKIKDGVDLKELENFGFVKESYFWYFGNPIFDGISIVEDSKIIYMEIDRDYESPLYDTLFELIKADMVEKVEE